MFFAQRPSREAIDRFVRDSQALPISYGPIGIVNGETPCRDLDETTVTIERGRTDFERATSALVAWKQFDTGWVEVAPRHASVEVGTVVAVLIRHLGFWSLNGCRVMYTVGGDGRFGFAYGTLTNHAESGEELFEVRLDPENDDVTYRIRATSSPQAMLTRVGQPIVRRLQARFRHDSALVMKRAMREFGAQP